MAVNKVREMRRKEIAKKEIENMLRRYYSEVPECKVRKATPEEMKRIGRMTEFKEFNRHKELSFLKF